ncbi:MULTISPECIES: hypothetical protein [Methylobacterium]|uniref:hypothetical protein n=1 Tax=Methylobacterium TaxID=407 RepID=UPI0012E8E20E|nr:hypothetical protein [Methylobacterium sp. Leaf85]
MSDLRAVHTEISAGTVSRHPARRVKTSACRWPERGRGFQELLIVAYSDLINFAIKQDNRVKADIVRAALVGCMSVRDDHFLTLRFLTEVKIYDDSPTRLL